jgi:hypothetical protein
VFQRIFGVNSRMNSITLRDDISHGFSARASSDTI